MVALRQSTTCGSMALDSALTCLDDAEELVCARVAEAGGGAKVSAKAHNACPAHLDNRQRTARTPRTSHSAAPLCLYMDVDVKSEEQATQTFKQTQPPHALSTCRSPAKPASVISPVMSMASRRVVLLRSSSLPGGKAAMLAMTWSRMRTTAGNPFLRKQARGYNDRAS